ncbi:MAG: hypothetical protein JWQ19_3095 [Subtercola sp.]|nr:hypothetical protein [Subtercola sp.]
MTEPDDPVRPPLPGVPAPAEITAQTALAFANACLAYTGVEAPKSMYRPALERVARGDLSADDAIAQVVVQSGLRIAPAAEQGSFIVHDFDDYLIEGSFTLRNRLVDSEHPFGIDDAQLFRELEVEISRIRLVELWLDPVIPTFEYDHLKQIHRRLFADIYSWAGSERVGPDSAVIRFAPDAVRYAAGDPAAPLTKYSYYAGPDVADAMSLQCAQLSRILAEPDLQRAEFLDRVAEHGSDIQTIHPFRDGNARACFVFIAQYCHAAGFPVGGQASPPGSPSPEQLSHSVYRYTATSEHDAVAAGLDGLLSPTRVSAPPPQPKNHRAAEGMPTIGKQATG